MTYLHRDSFWNLLGIYLNSFWLSSIGFYWNLHFWSYDWLRNMKSISGISTSTCSSLLIFWFFVWMRSVLWDCFRYLIALYLSNYSYIILLFLSVFKSQHNDCSYEGFDDNGLHMKHPIIIVLLNLFKTFHSVGYKTSRLSYFINLSILFNFIEFFNSSLLF
jgi:hypothetical protein